MDEARLVSDRRLEDLRPVSGGRNDERDARDPSILSTI
jgi:hypothetical protein